MPDDFESPLDKTIREARERGDLDNLPGKGKPIQWEDDSAVPDDQRLAHHMLKSAGFTLDWIVVGKELDEEYAALRRELERARAGRSAGSLDDAGWQSAASRFTEKVRALNRRIIGYNLRVPHERFNKRPYPVDPGPA